jgi:hypothetical protein
MTTVDPLQRLQEHLQPLKYVLLTHPIYREIDRLDALRRFMEHHVFAVWDFMSLLKTLQRRLCHVEVPWLPAADPVACRLINEIVLGEESDEDGRGGYSSHFDLYHTAMTRCGANTTPIDGFLDELRRGKTVSDALESPGVPNAARHFVRGTFDIIESGCLCSIASAFTFGREDLLPAVFQSIVEALAPESADGLEVFKYYLNRHIGLDGDEHGPMANRLLMSLCGSNESHWRVAEQTAVDCLEARRGLWDGIHDEIKQHKTT